ncbi:hypothetical protein [Streptomyces sp. NPDC058701]|uniref:hypothetical protein n=1 Tax=Streptomyces sp. NPDC058701 TaxID=3346608 RepID=UPI00365416A0
MVMNQTSVNWMSLLRWEPGDRGRERPVGHAVTRMQLPLSAPAPATFRQIFVVEDFDGDGLGDMFALDADGFWAFSGSFTSYRKLATGWAARDNANANRGLALRKGKPWATG